MMKTWCMLSMNQGMGSLVLTMTVYSSGVSMEAIALPSLTNWETSGLIRRSNVYLTSAAVKGLPLWNLTPLRRKNFQVSGSGCSYFSAAAYCQCASRHEIRAP